jgi:spermidine synthase
MDNNQQNFKIETAYNSIHMCYHDGRLELRSHDKALQSVINLENRQRLELKNLEYLMSVLLFTPAPQRILMLGTAAGSLLHFLRHHYPQADITAVDIDAELIERLLEMGILPEADAGLDYVQADAAEFITHCEQSYDLVLVDIFKGAQSPAWLLAKSVINHLYELLTGQGALACNLLIESDHDFGRFYRDFRQVFEQRCLSLPVAGLENRITLGVRAATEASDMSTNLQNALALSEKLEFDLMPILAVIYNTNPVGWGLI